MTHLFTGARRIAKWSAPAAVMAATAVTSVAAYSGALANGARHHHPLHTFTIGAKFKTVTLTPGSTVRVRITIRRRALSARVTLRVVSKLPPGIAATFAPPRTRGKRTTLSIKATARARPGRYRLRLRGTAGRLRRTLTLTLKVLRPTAAAGGGPAQVQTPPFSLIGDAAGVLEPGVREPLEIVVRNPNALPLMLTGLTVTVQGIVTPHATATLPCTDADFVLQQYSGPLPLTIPASSTRSLLELGVPPVQWPQIELIDRASNQDGCQGASLSLGYAGTGRLG